MTEELKPCPFCGCEAKMHAAFAHGIASRVGAYVECASCGAWSATQWGDGAQEKSADAWNRRAERTCRFETHQEPEGGEVWSECEECGSQFGWGGWQGIESARYCPHCGAKVVDE